MSILFREDKYNIFFIDHMRYVSKCYNNVKHDKNKPYRIMPKLFSIRCKTSGSLRKRKNDDNILEEALNIKAIYEKLNESLPAVLKGTMRDQYNLLDTATVRNLSKELFESTVCSHQGMNGGNSSDVPLVCQINGSDFLVPGKCRFMSGCVKEECIKLNGNKYDIVIADPPWWNKYIRRLKKVSDKLSYSMMYNEEIASIPVANLLSDTCLIAVWCTNAPSNISAVKDLIFPKWGVEYVTTWFWLKLTVDFEPICPFSSGSKKQPYERLIIGRKGELELPENLLFASIPSALHSHKPPLLDLFSYHIKNREPQILELFARYLLPNTTSVGYEPLKWQHLLLYEEYSNKE